MIRWGINILVLLFPLSLSAQINQSPEQIIGDLMESISERDIDLNNHSQVFDEMMDLYVHPVGINSVEMKDLEKLVFLSDLQIENTIDFIKKNGPISSVYQLQGIEGMPVNRIRQLLLFVRIEEDLEFESQRKSIRGQIILRDQFYVEKAKGYRSDTVGSSYPGNNHHSYLKAQGQFGNSIYGGITMDKDPGETVFKSNYKPVDFVSMHIMYQGDKFLKSLIVGDYHANFGQGLALWSGTVMGKSSEPLQVRKRGEGFKKYTSANEYSFFRGVAATMQIKNVELSVFGSQKNRDAKLVFDSLENRIVAQSLPESGYHRTASELESRSQLQQRTFGANLNYRYKDLSLSVGAYHHQYRVDSISVKQMYQQLAMPGVESSHGWVGYNYGLKRFISFGEFAITGDGYSAILAGVQFVPANNVSLAMVYRHFSSNYYSVWTNAFSEYSSPSGETGYYIGLTLFPIAKLKVAGYMDIFKNNWLKYNLDSPSNGYEISVQTDYEFNDRFVAYLRYREKEKAANQSGEISSQYPVGKINTKKIRLHTSFLLSDNWHLQMRIEKSFFRDEVQVLSKGMLSFTGVKYTSNNKKMVVWSRYAIFNTDNYDTRIYVYENDLLYNFSVPSLQGEGTRMYFLFRYELMKNVKLWCKIAQSWYADKKEIGSGLQAINGNTQTNIKMQLQIKF